MAIIHRSIWLAALTAFAALGVAGGYGSDRATAHTDGMSCDIRVIRGHGAITLQPVVSTPRAMSGSYRLHVTKRGGGGSSDIEQSGDFSASPGRSSELGEVSLAGGGFYDARLTVDLGGRILECRQRVGGSL